MDKIASNTFDSIIFDIDGTLWDTTGICAKAWNQAINDNSDLKAEINADQLKGLFGKTMDVIFDALFGKLDLRLQELLMQKCNDYEMEVLEKTPSAELKEVAFPGVVENMKELAKGHQLFIVSNCQCGYAELLIEKLGIEKEIKDHLCFGETNTSKGQTMLKLIERNNLKSPVYVGDTLGDQDACEEAAVPFIWAAYGFGKCDKYYKMIEKFNELLEI